MRPLIYRLITTAFATACTLCAGVSAYSAEDSSITRILVPFTAGGATDVVARLMAQTLTEMWGQRVLVDNKPGAAGTIASKTLVQSPPDGRTLLIVASGHAINELIYDKLPYRTVEDFTPITQVADIPNVLIVPKDSRYKSVADLIAAAKAAPDTVTYGTAGSGTSVHLAGELFKAMSGAQIVPVHFKGDSESIIAVMGNHITASFNTVPGAKVQLQAGSVRALAVTSATRSPSFPDLPTIGESAIKGYSVSNWFGVLGPRGMDAKLVARLNADMRKALSTPATVKKLEDLGIIIKVGTAEEFDALIRSDLAKWKPVIDKLGLRGSNL